MKPDSFLGTVTKGVVLRFGGGAGHHKLALALPRDGATDEGEDVYTHGAAGFGTRAPVSICEVNGLK